MRQHYNVKFFLVVQAKYIAHQLIDIMLFIHPEDSDGQRCCAEFIQEVNGNTDALSVGGLFYLTRDYIVTVGVQQDGVELLFSLAPVLSR